MGEFILLVALLVFAMHSLAFAEPRESKRKIGVIVVDVQGDFTAAKAITWMAKNSSATIRITSPIPEPPFT